MNPIAARAQEAERNRAAMFQDAEDSYPNLTRTTNVQSQVKHVDIPPQLPSIPVSATQNIVASSAQENRMNTEALSALCDKIVWSTEQLRQTTVIETSIQLCNLIKSSADAIKSIKEIQ